MSSKAGPDHSPEDNTGATFQEHIDELFDPEGPAPEPEPANSPEPADNT